MNIHNGRFMNIWKGYCSEDSIPNIEKLALFVRSIKRIDKLNFYKIWVKKNGKIVLMALSENQEKLCVH